MKKCLSYFVIATLMLLSGCNSDSNPTTDPIQGQWKLINISGTFAGIDDDFTPGLITWDFNPISQMVTVVNNNTDATKWDILETGVYAYRFINNPDSLCGESLEIDSSLFGCYSIANNTLIIDQSISDGFVITLNR
jgi:hypothetical protein